MLAALICLAEILAWNGSHAGASVYNQGLRLLMCAKVDSNIVVHEISRIAIEWCRVDRHVHHFIPID